jgi:hypothetical protein
MSEATPQKRGLFKLLATLAMLGHMGSRFGAQGNQGSHAVQGRLGGRDGFAHDFRREHLRKIKAQRGIRP